MAAAPREPGEGRASSPAYRTIAPIARGGMGTVELVVRQDGAFGRVYALKRMLPELAEQPEPRAMFLEEARIAGLLRHAHVVSVLDVGEDRRGPYLVMDYVEGISASTLLGHRARSSTPIPLWVAVTVARQASEGLRAAHELRGAGDRPVEAIHRDVSPSNILLGFDGVTRLTDFGVARALDRRTETRAGVKGKLGYMCPEQLRGEPLDGRSDLFSLGVVLFEMLAGHKLYRGTGAEKARQILDEPPPDVGEDRPDAPPELVALLFELLAKSPEARPRSAAEVARRLDAILADLDEPGPYDLREYLETRFAEEREAQRRLVATALEDPTRTLDARPAVAEAPTRVDLEPVAPVASARRRRWSLPLAALLLASALLGGLAALSLSLDPAAPAPEAPASAGPVEAPPPGEPSPEEQEPSAPPPPAEAPSEAPAEETAADPITTPEPAGEEAEAPATVGRPRRRLRGRPGGGGRASKVPTWDWE